MERERERGRWERRRPGVVRLQGREEEGRRRRGPVGDGARGDGRDAAEGECSGGRERDRHGEGNHGGEGSVVIHRDGNHRGYAGG